MTRIEADRQPRAEGSGAREYFAHPQAIVESSTIGPRTRVWAFAHVLPGARIGADCNICDGVFVENRVVVGDRVTVKCGVQLWDGVTLEDDVFVGPNATFTNDLFPRSRQYPDEFPATLVERGASVGANATILPGVVVGADAMVGAGAVVTKDVPRGAIVVGNPARVVGSVADREAAASKSHPHPKLVELPLIPDDRGLLTFGQTGSHIPFVIRRYYAILSVPPGKQRGRHAHRAQQGFTVCLAGGFSMTLDNGHEERTWRLDSPGTGLYVPPMHWNVLFDFTPDAVVLCLASAEYDEADYIRDYAEFARLTRET